MVLLWKTAQVICVDVGLLSCLMIALSFQGPKSLDIKSHRKGCSVLSLVSSRFWNKRCLGAGIEQTSVETSSCLSYASAGIEQRQASGETSSVKDAVDRLVELGSAAEYYAVSSVLKQCGRKKMLAEGKRVHAAIVAGCQQPDRLVQNHLVEMYAKCGSLEDAWAVFDGMRSRNVFSWTIMIAAFAQNGHCREALCLFRRMDLEGVKANSVTFINVIGACSGLQDLAECEKLHARAVSEGLVTDVILGTALITMYGKCGGLDDARLVFEGMQRRDVVAWSAMIAAYAQQGHCEECLALYRRMEHEKVKANEVTFVSVIDACASLADLEQGRRVQACILENGLETDGLRCALVDMYGKCGNPKDAREVFDRMRYRETRTWNAMISAYAQQGQSSEALRVFQQMEFEGIKKTEVTFISLLGGYSNHASLAEGRKVHARIVASGYEGDVVVRTALMTMYAKCGAPDDARLVFDKINSISAVSFNAMIAAYAEHGHTKEALELYWEMDQAGFTPDDVTLLSILFSCSHAGLLEEGLQNFLFMTVDRGIKVAVEHYRCMIDLLARAGWLQEAEELIETLFPEDVVAWLSLLSACKHHADAERGARAANRITELDPNCERPYKLLTGIYAAAVDKVRAS